MKIKSPKQAIKAKCKECIYDPQGGGTWVEQIERCTSYQCPLYELRPVSGKTKKIRRENYLASLSHSEREIVENRARNLVETLAKTRSIG